MDEKRLERIEMNLVEHLGMLHNIDKTLIRQEGTLKEHMRRTRAAEESVAILKEEIQTTRSDLETKIRPIQRHVDGINYILAAVGVLSLLCSAAFGAIKLYEWSKSTKSEAKSDAQVPEVRPKRQR